ncbi:MAG: acetoacetate--CoA ligase [Lautropia sp.]
MPDAVHAYVPGDVIWAPSADRIAGSNLTRFMRKVQADWGVQVNDYASLHAFSIEAPGQFWESAWQFCEVIGDRGAAPAFEAGATIRDAKWFDDAQLNFAENLLRVRDTRVVISAWDELGRREDYTGVRLCQEVSRVMQALQSAGVTAGDRVAAFLPNVPEALIAMIATTALGAVWSICSPELGASAVVDRLLQIAPKVLFVADRVRYAGKIIELGARGAEIAAALPSLRLVVEVPCVRRAADGSPERAAGSEARDGLLPRLAWGDWSGRFVPGEIAFERFGFRHPCYILFSSGTTGKPKCIVHGVGGTLVKHLVDYVLQNDVREDDCIFRVTIAGWMLWNFLASALACRAKVVLYDGSPTHPDSEKSLDIVAAERVTLWGVPPAILERLEADGKVPRDSHDLTSLRTLTSGGTALAPSSYVWVYDKLKRDLHLASPSGGTDVISFLAAGNPIGPCRVGEIQVRALGVALEIFDDDGRPVVDTQGELVLTGPIPSMPVGFWGDEDQSRYRQAYFSRFDGVWTHGDWARLTPHGGVVIYGRSDATLKVRGVRIGTAEIYEPLKAIPAISEAAAVEQVIGGESRVLLFVTLAAGVQLTDELVRFIKTRIAERASPRHVPDVVIAAPALPQTATGKVSEVAIRNAVSGRSVGNQQSLLNPASLAFFSELGHASRGV